MKHRRDIEGLRALAVISVIAYHAGVPGTAGGFIGVDSFLVISGFLITGLLIGEREQTGGVDLVAFYARRARRLLPISTLVLVVTALVGVAVLPATSLRDLGRDVLAAAGFSVNVIFAVRGTDYLAGDADPSAVQHYWSLAVEEQFYLLWPAVIGLITLRVNRVRRAIGIATGTIVVSSFASSVLLSSSAPTWSYFGLHTRAWELGVGAMIAVAVHRLPTGRPRAGIALSVAGLAGLGASVALIDGGQAFPGWIALAPVLSTAAVIVGGIHGSGAERLLGIRPLQWIGARSYSLYLWHWPVLILAPHAIGSPLTGTTTTVAIAVAVALSELGHRFIENPLRFSTALSERPRRSLAFGLGAVAVAATVGVATANRQPDLTTGVVAAAPEIVSAPTTTPAPTPTNDRPASTAIETQSTTSTLPPLPPKPDNRGDLPLLATTAALDRIILPDNLRPGLYEASTDTSDVYTTGCHQFLASTPATPCDFGDREGSITIGLLGDSHAAQWFAPIESMAANNAWRLISHTQGGCPIFDVTTWNRGAGTYLTQCEPWRQAVLDEFEQAAVDVVIISQHWGLLTGPDGMSVPSSAWEVGLPATIEAIRSIGAEPILILDSPDPYDSVPACAAVHRADLTPCEPGRLRQVERSVRDAAMTVADQLDVGIIDPHRWLCVDLTPGDDDDTTRCPVVIGDILVYRDSHHLTNTVAEWMTPVLSAELVPWISTQADS